MWIAPIGQTATQFPQATHFLGSIIIALSVRNRVCFLSAPRAVASAARATGRLWKSRSLPLAVLKRCMNYRCWKGGKKQPEISTTFGFKANIQPYTQIGRLIEDADVVGYLATLIDSQLLAEGEILPKQGLDVV